MNVMSNKEKIKDRLLDGVGNILAGFMGGANFGMTLHFALWQIFGREVFSFGWILKGSLIFSLFFAYYMGREEK